MVVSINDRHALSLRTLPSIPQPKPILCSICSAGTRGKQHRGMSESGGAMNSDTLWWQHHLNLCNEHLAHPIRTLWIHTVIPVVGYQHYPEMDREKEQELQQPAKFDAIWRKDKSGKSWAVEYTTRYAGNDRSDK
jgi:hypothetical protein